MQAKLREESPITLSDVWLAYRKAKFEAYRDRFCAHAFKYVKFERDLIGNLAEAFDWLSKANYEPIEELPKSRKRAIPKSLKSTLEKSSSGHFVHFDQVSDWIARHKSVKADVAFRDLMDPPVQIQLLDILWCLRTGSKIDNELEGNLVFANRLRRRYSSGSTLGPVNFENHALFNSYVYQYGLWRKTSLDKTKEALEAGNQILVFTLDISSYYDSIDAHFLLDSKFIEHFPLDMSQVDLNLTKSLLAVMDEWRTDFRPGEKTGIPIGLKSSAIIANAYLSPFDSLVRKSTNPIFYGRYVDDIFLCVSVPENEEIKSANQAKEWLANKIPWLHLENEELCINLPYAEKSAVRFGLKKERIFLLEGDFGINLIQTISEHMAQQSSEFKLIPTLTDSESELVDKVLMVTTDASLEGVVIREADNLTIRRSGLADVLRRYETVCTLLPSGETKEKRDDLCRLLLSHLMTPQSFFDFYQYVPRFFALMVRHGDWANLRKAGQKIIELRAILENYTTASESQLDQTFDGLYRLIEQAIIQSSHPNRKMKIVARFISILPVKGREIANLSSRNLRSYVKEFWLADWGNISIGDSLKSINGNKFNLELIPLSVRQRLFVEDINFLLSNSRYGKVISNKNWKGLLFPTRPMRIQNLTKSISIDSFPIFLSNASNYYGFKCSTFGKACIGLCGRRISPLLSPRIILKDDERVVIRIGRGRPKDTIVGVSSFETDYKDLISASEGKPNLSLDRYNHLAKFLNGVLLSDRRPDFFVLPELCLPRAFRAVICSAFGNRGISLISGQEYAYADKKNSKYPLLAGSNFVQRLNGKRD